jgi:hypothetical protein
MLTPGIANSTLFLIGVRIFNRRNILLNRKYLLDMAEWVVASFFNGDSTKRGLGGGCDAK